MALILIDRIFSTFQRKFHNIQPLAWPLEHRAAGAVQKQDETIYFLKYIYHTIIPKFCKPHTSSAGNRGGKPQQVDFIARRMVYYCRNSS
ncbi:hypothetical protein DPQ25_04075 [Hydrogeniiclostridium mannosilyticum]|uniref:Uncharacterized protein n=1 Tax=Hydrogeniiclostridium mannosilyticum TaxID=2764322 RepID=A0A328UKF5_9FIRM|nr:hypothetical protein DPQ25_04075 [Hydrogeniiclostridium mannosilyticum]